MAKGYKLQIARSDKSAIHRIVPIVTRDYCTVMGILEKANEIFGDVEI